MVYCLRAHVFSSLFYFLTYNAPGITIYLTIRLNVKMRGRDEFLGIQDTLKALADPIRREILNLLKKWSAFSRRDMRTFFSNGSIYIKTSGSIKGG